MKLHSIDAGDFKLDGGAMFGVVPKTIWQKLIPADENNMCSWKMRCLLLEYGTKLVLVDTGMGTKQSEKWQGYYFRHGNGELISSIHTLGFHEDQITDVILTHLHFDHCGGAVSGTPNGGLIPTFKNANYWTHSDHWEWAMNPNPREKATFLSENLHPLSVHSCLRFIDKEEFIGDNTLPVEFLIHDGHTEKMILPVFQKNNQKFVFGADTIPSSAHIHIPFTMSYDVRPLQTMIEKQTLLDYVIEHEAILVFDHDKNYESCRIVKTDKGYKAKELGSIYDLE
ncbi:MAG: MBL fold metallo-hydrolase [Leadbetterella sp.]